MKLRFFLARNRTAPELARSGGVAQPLDDSEAFTMTPKPPMFPSPTLGLPLPLQLLARARLFMKFAGGGVAYDNGEMNWPKYALLLQAIELALKAYTTQDGRAEPKGLHNHDLKGRYEFARACGLPPLPADAAANLDILGPVHLDSSARYPKEKPIYELAHIAEETTLAIINAVDPLIKRPGR